MALVRCLQERIQKEGPLMSKLLPAVFIGHGNPMNALLRNPYTEAWSTLGTNIPRPKTVLCISAHWFAPGTGVHHHGATHHSRLWRFPARAVPGEVSCAGRSRAGAPGAEAAGALAGHVG